jgi:type I restriction enzyme S subunit
VGDARLFGELFAEGTRNGLTRPKAVRGAGVKMVNMGELFAYPRLRNAPMDRVPLSEEEAERVLLKPGDLLFARQSLVLEGAGKCSIFLNDDEPMTFESHVTRVRLDPREADPRFYFYYLQSHHGRAAITSIVEQGAGASGIRGSDLAKLEVLWRPVPEQRAIAHILGTLDDKIELNRRMSETLEAMARALFKSWFVDFDPVRAKAGGRDPGLPKPLADLFPDSFEDSELGEIPKGWATGRFGEVVEQLRDQENPLSSPDVLYHHFSIPALDEGQTPRLEYGDSIKSLKSRVPAGVVLLSKLNPEIERVWFVDVGAADRAVCSTEFLVLRARRAFTRSFVYCLARSPVFRQQIEGLVTGTSKSHQRAQVDSILNLAVIMPPSSTIAAFDCSAERLLGQTLGCRRESCTLALLRDTLLPKLISGELRVKDAERFTAEAV